jgi:hypothetical protein
MSTLKVDTITTISGTGNINVSRPLSGSGASLTNLPAANLTGTLPALSGASLTNLPAANLTGTLPAISGASLTNLPSSEVTYVQFPATQVASADANRLDDYEEGTWTPVYADDSGNSGTTTGAGKYTKIGDLVYLTFQSKCTNLNSMNGSVRITGVPFTSANNATYPAGTIGYMSSIETPLSGQGLYFHMAPNTAFLAFYLNDTTTGTTAFLPTELSTNGFLFGSISYKV